MAETVLLTDSVPTDLESPGMFEKAKVRI